MPTLIFCVVYVMVVSRCLSADSFQEELLRARHEVRQTIGEERLQRIEDFAAKKEIYRITQLLNIPSIGKKTVVKLGEILGYQFEYLPTLELCVKMRSC